VGRLGSTEARMTANHIDRLALKFYGPFFLLWILYSVDYSVDFIPILSELFIFLLLPVFPVVINDYDNTRPTMILDNLGQADCALIRHFGREEMFSHR
jgi:hypothetical protein